MKKAAALILVLAMVLALCACGGSKSISEQLNGTKWHWDDPTEAGNYLDMSFTDHTIRFSGHTDGGSGSAVGEYTCPDDNSLVVSNGSEQEVIYFQLENDTLTLYFSDYDVYVFTRVK